ncbi:MAG: AAA family ATPase [Methylococcales bacterium]
MKICAIYSIKGGVGKTATAVNLAYLSAKSGYKTLLWDLDPQGASSFYFRIKPKVKGGGKELITGKRELDDLIKGSDFDNLDVLPADFSFRKLDIVLDARKKPTQRLHKLLEPLASEYDIIFLDCPPSISLLSEAVFEAADFLLTPLIPTTLSLRTLEQLIKFLEYKDFKKLQLIPFFSMVDKRKKMHSDSLIALSAEYPDILKTVIPYASDIERMGLERLPLGAYTKKSTSLDAYNALWQEILSYINTEENTV